MIAVIVAVVSGLSVLSVAYWVAARWDDVAAVWRHRRGGGRRGR